MLKWRTVTSGPAVAESNSAAVSDSKARTSLTSMALVFLCTLTGAAAQILMKRGADHTAGAGLSGLLTNLPLFIGYCIYGLNTVLIVHAFKQGHLSVLYPIIALSYVWVTILSPVYFHADHLNGFKIAGVALIVAGVSMIGIGSRR
jgi:multidrug transporter EmrE-like cation transporter